MHAQHGLPVVVGQLPDDSVSENAGVVDDDIDPAGGLEDVLDGGVDGGGIGHVGDQRDRTVEVVG